jgi:hypothetical protein
MKRRALPRDVRFALAELTGKRLELLAEIVPNLSRLAILMNPENPVQSVFLKELREQTQ